MAYSQQLIDHFENPRNVGSLDASSPCTGSAMVGSPQVGEVIRLQFCVAGDSGQIQQARFKAYGGVATIAVASLVTQRLQGQTPEAALAMRYADFAGELELPAIKMHSCILAQEAIKMAVANYRGKQIRETS